MHEAGYDAYITGYVYAKMFYALNNKEQEEIENSVNVMKSLTYFKNGNLGYKEPWFRNVSFFLSY